MSEINLIIDLREQYTRLINLNIKDNAKNIDYFEFALYLAGMCMAFTPAGSVTSSMSILHSEGYRRAHEQLEDHLDELIDRDNYSPDAVAVLMELVYSILHCIYTGLASDAIGRCYMRTDSCTATIGEIDVCEIVRIPQTYDVIVHICFDDS